MPDQRLVEQIGYTPVPVTDVRELAARVNLAAARLDLPHTRGNTTTEHFIDWAKDLANVGAAGEERRHDRRGRLGRPPTAGDGAARGAGALTTTKDGGSRATSNG